MRPGSAHTACSGVMVASPMGWAATVAHKGVGAVVLWPTLRVAGDSRASFSGWPVGGRRLWSGIRLGVKPRPRIASSSAWPETGDGPC